MVPHEKPIKMKNMTNNTREGDTLIEIGPNVTIIFATKCNYIYFATISCVGHIYDYNDTNFQLFWCSSFHVNNI